MERPFILRSVLVGTLAAVLVLSASRAQAQGGAVGTLRGSVTDADDKPLAGVVLTLDFLGDYNLTYEVKTDKKGDFIRVGLPSGSWRVTGKQGELSGNIKATVTVTGEILLVKLVLRSGAAAKAVVASKLDAAEIEKRNKKNKELETAFNAASADADAGNFDDAIAKLTAIAADMPQCASCYAKLGDVYAKKGDGKKAEDSYNQSIQIDPNVADVYSALSTLYNSQKRFDEAGKMGDKATELQTKGGGTGDPTTMYNQGIILWNQGKGPEAQPLFEKALAGDPTMSEAHYMLGLIFVGQDKKPEAIKEFDAYLKQAPTGKNADTAKALLASIK